MVDMHAIKKSSFYLSVFYYFFFATETMQNPLIEKLDDSHTQ